MEEAYHGAKVLKNALRSEEEQLQQVHDQVAQQLQSLTGQTLTVAEWADSIMSISDRQKRLQDKLGQKKLTEARLNVDPSAYQAEPTSAAFDPQQLEKLQEEQEKLVTSLQKKSADQASLKQRICDHTGDNISTDWESLLCNLQQARAHVAFDYRQISAKIIAGILVNQALDTIRAQEDKNIREKLSSSLVCAPIEQLTGRYSAVHYDDGQLDVSDPYGDFPLADLSTGAREQVLLGLRLGFAAQIFGHNRLFLVLDDAFQHADWERRERLLYQMVDLAHGGWQIIYLTMDDHIKKLFDAAGKQNFGEKYHSYDLNESAIFMDTLSIRENP